MRSTMGDRGVSDVIGFVLVFSLVATTVGIVSVTGFDVLNDARNSEQVSNGQRAFDVLADNLEDIHESGAPSRSTEVDLTDAQLTTSETIIVNLSWEDTSDARPRESVNYSSRPIVWESSSEADAEVVYSLGAVVRSSAGTGEVMLKEPPFVLKQDRLLLPLVRTTVDEPQTVGGSTVRVNGVGTGSALVNASTTGEYDVVWLNITTPRTDAWQSYLGGKDVTERCVTEATPRGGVVACEFETADEFYASAQTIGIEIQD